MKAGEHLKALSWGNAPKVLYDRRHRDDSREDFSYKVLPPLTREEYRIVRQIDPWKARIEIKDCPLCGGKYIPTPQSEKRCIPCNHI